MKKKWIYDAEILDKLVDSIFDREDMMKKKGVQFTTRNCPEANFYKSARQYLRRRNRQDLLKFATEIWWGFVHGAFDSSSMKKRLLILRRLCDE